METENQFTSGTITYNNGILHIEYFKNAVLNEEVLLKQILHRKTLTGKDDFFMLVDLRGDLSVTDGALALAAENPCPEHVKAIALITKQGTDYNKAKLYSLFDRPNIHTKVFLSPEAAMSWFSTNKSIFAA